MRGAITFGDVVRTLTAEGVESYHTDIIRREETFYMPNGETHVEPMNFTPRPIAELFSAPGVIAAIRASQAGQSTYLQFLERITNAGVTNYTVYLAGKRCIYLGRGGEFHVEEFPAAKA
jgi:uncharacterized protein YbcV (DUF1398 family)